MPYGSKSSIPYVNLCSVMAKEGISETRLANALNLGVGALKSKLCGRSRFSVAEAFLLRDAFFRQYGLEWLFSR